MKSIEVKQLSYADSVNVKTPKKDLSDLGIDPYAKYADLFWQLEKMGIPASSWIINTLETVRGRELGFLYEIWIQGETCQHGMLGDCTYCKWGTE